jgi:hypothetical protein
MSARDIIEWPIPQEREFYNLKFHHRDTEGTEELPGVLCASVVKR